MDRAVPLAVAATRLPNLLTYGRILAVPAVAACLYLIEGPAAWWSALFIFTLAAITDYFDGYLARIWNEQSALGRMLDPIADKLLVGVVLLLLVARSVITGWSLVAAIIILSREILVSGLREFLAELKVPVPVTQLAKWKTTFQMVALGALLAGPGGEEALPGLTAFGLALLWCSALLTAYTGYAYFSAGLKHVAEPGLGADGKPGP